MRRIKLTLGLFALLDDEDYEKLRQYSWYAAKTHGSVYAARMTSRKDGPRKTVLMHREIMAAEPGVQIDHADHNGLNNQKSNLRACSQSQNQANMRKLKGVSKFKGVSWHPKTCKWRAQIYYDGRIHHLGLFFEEQDAAQAYADRACEVWGEFSHSPGVEGVLY